MSDCTAAKHGDHNAYMVDNCRCPEARESYRLYRKQLREDRRPPAHIDNTGTRRRLQALTALGWSPSDLAERLGCQYTQVQHLRNDARRSGVSRQIADKVAAVYEELQGTPGPSQRARSWAEKFGWAPPLAWDDGAIDDPAAQPVTGAGPRSRVDLDDVQHLQRFGVSREEIARRMGVEPESIERAEYRAAQRARTAAALAAAHQAMHDDEPVRWSMAPTMQAALEHAFGRGA